MASRDASAATALDVLLKCSICDSQFPSAAERDAHFARCLSQQDSERTPLGMSERTLTRLQEDVLLVVEENGPVTARDVAYHLPIGEASACGALSRLEAKSLIDATYTGHHRGSGRAYVARR